MLRRVGQVTISVMLSLLALRFLYGQMPESVRGWVVYAVVYASFITVAVIEFSGGEATT